MNHAKKRLTFIAGAVIRCCTCVLARPMERLRRRVHIRTRSSFNTCAWRSTRETLAFSVDGEPFEWLHAVLADHQLKRGGGGCRTLRSNRASCTVCVLQNEMRVTSGVVSSRVNVHVPLTHPCRHIACFNLPIHGKRTAGQGSINPGLSAWTDGDRIEPFEIILPTRCNHSIGVIRCGISLSPVSVR